VLNPSCPAIASLPKRAKRTGLAFWIVNPPLMRTSDDSVRHDNRLRIIRFNELKNLFKNATFFYYIEIGIPFFHLFGFTMLLPYDPDAKTGVKEADKLLVPYEKYVELWNRAYPDKKIENWQSF
jgi:hypothetical protein